MLPMGEVIYMARALAIRRQAARQAENRADRHAFSRRSASAGLRLMLLPTLVVCLAASEWAAFISSLRPLSGDDGS